MVELNEFLQPVGSPITQNNYVSGYEFESGYESSLISTSKIREIIADRISAGTVSVSINVGDGNVTIDGANKRILINDGTNDRVLIGYQSGGF